MGSRSEERPKRYPVVDLAEFRMRIFRALEKGEGESGPVAPTGHDTVAP